jgi:hypothetical protein
MVAKYDRNTYTLVSRSTNLAQRVLNGGETLSGMLPLGTRTLARDMLRNFGILGILCSLLVIPSTK